MSIAGLLNRGPAQTESLNQGNQQGRQEVLLLPLLLLSGFLFYLAPWWELWLPAFAAMALLSWWRLDLALVLVPASVPYFMQPKHFGSAEFAPSEIFIVLDTLIAAGWLLTGRASLSTSWERLRSVPFRWPALLFLVSALLSTALAADRHLALRWLRETVVEPMVFYCLCVVFLRAARNWLNVFGGVLIAGLGAGGAAIWETVTGQGLSQVPGSTLKRAPGPYGSPDNLALLLDRAVTVWLALALYVTGLLSGARRATTPLLVVTGLIGLVLLASLGVTYSRGAWVAAAIACLLTVGLGLPRTRRAVVVLALLGVVTGAAASPRLIHAFRSNQTNTVQKRLDIWQSSLEIIRDHPIFGVGMDNFTHYYAPPHQAYAPCSGLGYMKSGASDEPCLSHPHNEILDFWLSLGLAGLVAYVWLLWTFLSASRRAWKQSPGLRFPMLLGAAGAMIAGVLHGLVDNSYFLIDLATLFWLLCAYVSWCVSAPDPA